MSKSLLMSLWQGTNVPAKPTPNSTPATANPVLKTTGVLRSQPYLMKLDNGDYTVLARYEVTNPMNHTAQVVELSRYVKKDQHGLRNFMLSLQKGETFQLSYRLKKSLRNGRVYGNIQYMTRA